MNLCRFCIKLINALLSYFSANALLMNDDCQTPLDVARAKGQSKVVRAIEVCVNARGVMQFKFLSVPMCIVVGFTFFFHLNEDDDLTLYFMLVPS